MNLHSPKQMSLNVVITGSTKGIGLSLAKQFLNNGDNVIISSRNTKNINNALTSLNTSVSRIHAYSIDVSNYNDCYEFTNFVNSVYDNGVDIWINNAGTCSYCRKDFIYFSNVEINTIVNTNLIGTMYCCKHAIPSLKTNGTIINLEGAGSNGFPTVGYSVYGSTKIGIKQFTKTLQLEYPYINAYTLSPGMVMTDLIKSNLTSDMKKIFNVFCETPDTVAEYVVPIIRYQHLNNISNDIHYLTVFKIIQMLFISLFKKNRFFDI